MENSDNQKNQGIQVISRAATILRLLGEETDGMSLQKIAAKVELPRSTVQRIVSALALEGLIASDQRDSGIKLGPEIQRLARASSIDVKDWLRPVMRSISEQTGETVDLAKLEGHRMRFIDQIVGTHRLRTVSSIGEVFPLTTTANGKAALAMLGTIHSENLIENEVQTGNLSKARQKNLLLEIDNIRQGTLAQDEDEHTDGISALGFAVKNDDGDVFALSTPVPSNRYTRVKDLLTDVLLEHRSKIIDTDSTI